MLVVGDGCAGWREVKAGQLSACYFSRAESEKFSILTVTVWFTLSQATWMTWHLIKPFTTFAGALIPSILRALRSGLEFSRFLTHHRTSSDTVHLVTLKSQFLKNSHCLLLPPCCLIQSCSFALSCSLMSLLFWGGNSPQFWSLIVYGFLFVSITF